MELTRDHDLAIQMLPVDGRWQTEAQLRGQTQLGPRTHWIYEDLVERGFCDKKAMPIICRIVLPLEFTRMYRCRETNRLRYLRVREREISG